MVKRTHLRHHDPRRAVDFAKRSLRRVTYRGRRFYCPVCRAGTRALLPQGDSVRLARCPVCSSLERHRALWVYLSREMEVADSQLRVLHVAPELALERIFRRNKAWSYETLDLLREDVDIRASVAEVPLPDASVDLYVASHVLEHVADDVTAMREITRLLSDHGTAVLQVPFDPTRARTFEDPSVTDPDERRRLFGQDDHVRIYGRDLVGRLEAEGLSAKRVDPSDFLTPGELDRLAVQVAEPSVLRETLWVCARA